MLCRGSYCEVVFATPGRLIDYMEKLYVVLNQYTNVVLVLMRLIR